MSRSVSGLTPMRGLHQPSAKVVQACFEPMCGFLLWLRFALRSLALCGMCAIAPSFVSSWQAFSSVALCKFLQSETEEKARQPETILGAIAQTRHKARRRNARRRNSKRSQTKNPKTTHKAQNRPDRHREALPGQRATLSSRSAPAMKAARERPSPPACGSVNLVT
jgi:hypothetical protein